MNILTIARVTLLEALRCRIFFLTAVVLLGLFGFAEFLGTLSITEANDIKAAVTAALLRVISVLALCLTVLGNGLRELHDKRLETILSLPLPVHTYLFGKLSGFAALSLLICLMGGLILSLYAAPARVCGWAFSLFLEHLLIMAFSLLCLFTFADILWSFMAVMAFYLLARSMETLSLLSAASALPSGDVAQDLMALLVQLLALLLPDLHAFTRSEWLLHGVGFAGMREVLLQAVLYLIILISAALFDLSRRNF